MRPLLIASVSAALFVGTAGASPHAAAKDPLRGSWDGVPYTITTLRNRLLGVGYSPNEITQYIAASGRNSPALKNFRFHLTFNRANGRPTVNIWGQESQYNLWDAHYDPRRYTLLPKHRVAFTWQKQRWVFAYRVSGKTLSLRVVTSSDSSKTKAEVRLDRQLLYEVAGASFHKAG